jgi:hypothetical protein
MSEEKPDPHILALKAMWEQPEYHGDIRSWQQRRSDAIDRQNEKYRRAAAYREGRLDEYDAIRHPERLQERLKAKAQ